MRCAYGVTDRHGADGARAGWPRTSASCAPAGGAWSACTPRSRAPTTRSRRPPGSAADLGVGVHIHVAEGDVDADAGAAARARSPATTGCSSTASTSTDDLPGTIAHNPRSNMNNAVGYARPAAGPNPIVLGTDGIGADMLEEFRLAYVRHREDDVAAVAGDGVVVARERLAARARGPRRPGARGPTTTPTRRGTLAFTHRRASRRRRGRTARSCSRDGRRHPGRCRRGASEGRRASRAACTGCYDRLDGHARRALPPGRPPASARRWSYVQYAEATRVRRGVAGREPARARGDRAHGRVRRGDRPDQGRQWRRRDVDPQPGAARVDVLDARRPRARVG